MRSEKAYLYDYGVNPKKGGDEAFLKKRSGPNGYIPITLMYSTTAVGAKVTLAPTVRRPLNRPCGEDWMKGQSSQTELI